MTRCWPALLGAIRVRAPLLVVLVLCAGAAAAGLLRMAYATIASPARAWTLSVAFDQLGNAAANGDPDETVSSRAGKARLLGRRWGCVLCKLLDWLDPGHCDRFIERDRGRRLP